MGPTRAATQAEGALWLELPVGRCGHRDGGLQVATRLPVGGGVGGFARAVGVCGSSDRRLLWQPAPSLNRLAELWLRLSCGFGFGWGLNRSAASGQSGNGAAAQMWQLPAEQPIVHSALWSADCRRALAQVGSGLCARIFRWRRPRTVRALRSGIMGLHTGGCARNRGCAVALGLAVLGTRGLAFGRVRRRWSLANLLEPADTADEPLFDPTFPQLAADVGEVPFVSSPRRLPCEKTTVGGDAVESEDVAELAVVVVDASSFEKVLRRSQGAGDGHADGRRSRLRGELFMYRGGGGLD